jgi:hypothetical protein
MGEYLPGQNEEPQPSMPNIPTVFVLRDTHRQVFMRMLGK